MRSGSNTPTPDSVKEAREKFKEDYSGVVNDGTDVTEYGWGSGNDASS